MPTSDLFSVSRYKSGVDRKEDAKQDLKKIVDGTWYSLLLFKCYLDPWPQPFAAPADTRSSELKA